MQTIKQPYDSQQKTLITIAKSWIGTPFRNNSIVKGYGCDCAGLILGTLLEYQNLHTTNVKTLLHLYKNHVKQDVNLREILLNNYPKVKNKPQAGNVVLFKTKNLTHLGIVSEFDKKSPHFLVIHAYDKIGKVTESKFLKSQPSSTSLWSKQEFYSII